MGRHSVRSEAQGHAKLSGWLLSETGKIAHKGDLVFVSLPSSPSIQMAKARGYLNVAYCNVDHLLKRLAAVPGERVTIDPAGVEVNGIRLANSTPLPFDGAGRPMQTYVLKDHTLGSGEVLLMSDYNCLVRLSLFRPSEHHHNRVRRLPVTHHQMNILDQLRIHLPTRPT